MVPIKTLPRRGLKRVYLNKLKNTVMEIKDGNVLIDVSLPNGLTTSYKKQIVFQQEMSGTADIVTKDLRLLERLLYQFRDVFKR